MGYSPGVRGWWQSLQGTATQKFDNPSNYLDVDLCLLCGAVDGVEAVLKESFPHILVTDTREQLEKTEEAFQYLKDTEESFRDQWTGFLVHDGNMITNTNKGGSDYKVHTFIGFKNETDAVQFKLARGF